MLNIVVPMAGRGSRFRDAGYGDPKPLIEIHGRRMIDYVIGNVRPRCEHRFHFLCLREHLERYGLEAHLGEAAPGCAVIPVDGVTEGAACTVLLAERFIDNGDPLMIANSDQYVDADIDDYLAAGRGMDGLIMTMRADDPKWSFVRIGGDGLVAEVREKEAISGEATVGIYNFARGADFVRHARRMVAEDMRVNGEFYVAPVYNLMIADGAMVSHYNVGGVGDGMYGLGVPADLEAFAGSPVSRRALGRLGGNGG